MQEYPLIHTPYIPSQKRHQLQDMVLFHIHVLTYMTHNTFPVQFSTMHLMHTLTAGTADKLLLLQKGLSLRVLTDDSPTLEWVAANDTRNADQQAEDEEDSHNYKGKDPLESNDMREELRHTKCCFASAQYLQKKKGNHTGLQERYTTYQP